jgi:hypothetical protein
MSIGSLGNGQPSPEEMREMQAEMEQQREDRQTAQQLASQAASQQGPAKPGYWDIIGSPDIGREMEDDHLEDYVATEFANSFALGNISKADWQNLGWRIETEFFTMKNEFKDSDGKMGDDDLRIMYGEDRPELTNEKARRLRSASEVKKLYTSLSVGARGLKSGTEIHAVAKTENEEQEEEGRLSGIKGWLSG